MILLYNKISDLGCDVFVLLFLLSMGVFVPKTEISMLLNTKYMKIMMQIKQYQPLKQPKYVCVCLSLSVCGGDHKHCYNNMLLLNVSGCTEAVLTSRTYHKSIQSAVLCLAWLVTQPFALSGKPSCSSSRDHALTAS